MDTFWLYQQEVRNAYFPKQQTLYEPKTAYIWTALYDSSP